MPGSFLHVRSSLILVITVLLVITGCEKGPFAKKYAIDFEDLLAEPNWGVRVTFSETNVGINASGVLSDHVLTLQGERDNSPRPWITARHTFEQGSITDQLRELEIQFELEGTSGPDPHSLEWQVVLDGWRYFGRVIITDETNGTATVNLTGNGLVVTRLNDLEQAIEIAEEIPDAEDDFLEFYVSPSQNNRVFAQITTLKVRAR